MSSHHLVGRSPEPSPCGYAVSGLATVFASLRRATRSNAQKGVGVRKSASTRRLVLPRRRPSQQRFRSRERLNGALSIEGSFNYMTRQEGAVEVSLDYARAVAQHTDPLAERLPGVGAGRVVELAQPGAGGTELVGKWGKMGTLYFS